MYFVVNDCSSMELYMSAACSSMDERSEVGCRNYNYYSCCCGP